MVVATGTRIPTTTPSATPRGTERRVNRHSSDRKTRCATGRSQRFLATSSRCGMFFLIQPGKPRSAEQPSELQSLMRSSYAVFFLHKKKNTTYVNIMNFKERS